MTAEVLLTELTRLGVTLTLAGDKLHVEATTGVLTPELKEALRQHKPALVAILRERETTKVVNNVFCFDCFKAGGKAAKYQVHTVAPYTWQGDSNWWELTCTRCGSKCYMRPKEGDEARG